jgi:hypothetical protein
MITLLRDTNGKRLYGLCIAGRVLITYDSLTRALDGLDDLRALSLVNFRV